MDEARPKVGTLFQDCGTDIAFLGTRLDNASNSILSEPIAQFSILSSNNALSVGPWYCLDVCLYAHLFLYNSWLVHNVMSITPCCPYIPVCQHSCLPIRGRHYAEWGCTQHLYVYHVSNCIIMGNCCCTHATCV